MRAGSHLFRDAVGHAGCGMNRLKVWRVSEERYSLGARVLVDAFLSIFLVPHGALQTTHHPRRLSDTSFLLFSSLLLMDNRSVAVKSQNWNPGPRLHLTQTATHPIPHVICLFLSASTSTDTFVSQWYLSPSQHVVEMAYSILVLSPLVYLCWKLCRSRLKLQRAAADFDFKRPNLLMKLWGIALLGLVFAGAFLKFYKRELISHPAFLWQPCHVHSLVMGLCAFIETEGSLLVLHVATTLWWGPFLAFVAPSLPTDPREVCFTFTFTLWVGVCLFVGRDLGVNQPSLQRITAIDSSSSHLPLTGFKTSFPYALMVQVSIYDVDVEQSIDR